MQTETRNRIKIVLRILIVISIAVAWGHSTMPVPVSKAESGYFLDFLKPFFGIFLPDEAVTDHLIRKMAHFSEYGVMGMEMTLYLQVAKGIKPKLLVNTLFSGLAIAFIDETIQIFPGRGPLITDLWIDLAGFTLGGLVMCLAVFVWHRLKGKGEEDRGQV